MTTLDRVEALRSRLSDLPGAGFPASRRELIEELGALLKVVLKTAGSQGGQMESADLGRFGPPRKRPVLRPVGDPEDERAAVFPCERCDGVACAGLPVADEEEEPEVDDLPELSPPEKLDLVLLLLDCCGELLELGLQAMDGPQVADMLVSRGRILISFPQDSWYYGLAWRQLAAALAYYPEEHRRWDRAVLLSVLSEALLVAPGPGAEERREAAREACEEALELAKKEGSMLLETDIRWTWGRALRLAPAEDKIDDLAEALQVYEGWLTPELEQACPLQAQYGKTFLDLARLELGAARAGLLGLVRRWR